MMRLFVGLALPAEVKQRLLALCGGIPGARWQDGAQLHITLRFIGEVDEPMAAAIDQALAGIEVPAFELALSGLGLFGKMTAPRTLWAGVEPQAPAAHLAARVNRQLEILGLAAEDRKLKPHVTLARFGGARFGGARFGGGRASGATTAALQRFLDGYGAFSSPVWPVTEFTLFQSHLSQSGAIYQPLARYALATPGRSCGQP